MALATSCQGHPRENSLLLGYAKPEKGQSLPASPRAGFASPTYGFCRLSPQPQAYRAGPGKGWQGARARNEGAYFLYVTEIPSEAQRSHRFPGAALPVMFSYPIDCALPPRPNSMRIVGPRNPGKTQWVMEIQRAGISSSTYCLPLPIARFSTRPAGFQAPQTFFPPATGLPDF